MKYLTNITKSACIVATSISISSCATYYALNNSDVQEVKKQHIMLQDKVIAIGRPSTPIPHYPYALILAGQKNSYLVQPVPSSTTPLNLFEQIYSQIDLNYIYLDPNNQISRNIQHNIKTPPENKLEFKLGNEPKISDLVNSKLGIYYLRELKKVPKKEKNQLAELGFQCDEANQSNTKYYLCNRHINTTIQVASQVKNINNIQHTLKQPLNIEFTYTQTKKNYRRVGLKALTPVAVAVDIITSPIQGAAVLLYGLAFGIASSK